VDKIDFDTIINQFAAT